MSHKYLHGCVYPPTHDDTQFPITVPDWRSKLNLVGLFLTAEHMDGKLPSLLMKDPKNALGNTAKNAVREGRAIGMVVKQDVRDDGSVWITARINTNSPDYAWLKKSGPLFLSLSHVQEGAIRAQAVEVGVTREPARRVPAVAFSESMTERGLKRPAEDEAGGDAKRPQLDPAELRAYIRRSNLDPAIKEQLEKVEGLTIPDLIDGFAEGHSQKNKEITELREKMSKQEREANLAAVLADMRKLAPDVEMDAEHFKEFPPAAIEAGRDFIACCASLKLAAQKNTADAPLPASLPTGKAPAANGFDSTTSAIARLFAT